MTTMIEHAEAREEQLALDAAERRRLWREGQTKKIRAAVEALLVRELGEDALRHVHIGRIGPVRSDNKMVLSNYLARVQLVDVRGRSLGVTVLWNSDHHFLGDRDPDENNGYAIFMALPWTRLQFSMHPVRVAKKIEKALKRA